MARSASPELAPVRCRSAELLAGFDAPPEAILTDFGLAASLPA